MYKFLIPAVLVIAAIGYIWYSQTKIDLLESKVHRANTKITAYEKRQKNTSEILNDVIKISNGKSRELKALRQYRSMLNTKAKEANDYRKSTKNKLLKCIQDFKETRDVTILHSCNDNTDGM